MRQVLPRVLVGERRTLFALLVANGFAQALAGLASARLTLYAFDVMVDGRPPGPAALAGIAAALCACALAIGWLRCRERVEAERMGQGYARELRSLLFDQLGRLSLRALQVRRRGSVMLRFVGDLKSFRQWLSLGLARLTVSAVTICASLLGLAVIDALLAAIALIVLLAGALVTARFGAQAQDSIRLARRRQSHLAANLGEKLASMAVVQLFGQLRRERRRLERQGARLEGAMIAQARAQARLRSCAEVTAHMAAAAVLVAGVLQVAAGATSLPHVAAAMTLVGLMVPALRDLGLVHSYYTAARVSRERVAAFLAQPVLADHAPSALGLITVRGSVEFRDVSLGDTLRGFSATAAPGRVTAIVGANGAGKSTLLALAARLLDPDSGAVLIDGQPLSSVTIESVRRSVGMVGADLPLLRGSLDRNLRYRWPNAPEDEVQRVRALCRIDEIEETLPSEARLQVQEGGANLSLGARQRIALARALLGRPAVLLLDEADVNLDAQSRRILDKVLRDFEGTVLMATHRIDFAARADALWVVTRGRLLVQGRPEDLLPLAQVQELFAGDGSIRVAA
jgi:ATP-binding cassette, subfamily B, bacterial